MPSAPNIGPMLTFFHSPSYGPFVWVDFVTNTLAIHLSPDGGDSYTEELLA